jgi:predicted nucleic acid-binding protein
VICLDTDYLVLALVPGTRESARIEEWLSRNETLAIPTVAWYEFLCAPVGDEEIRIIEEIARGCILPFGPREAREAERLFAAAGGARRLRVDAMIAATAIVANAGLATSNQEDFRLFTAFGLDLV